MAGPVIDDLSRADVVVVPSGSCTATIRNFYPELFAGTPRQTAARLLASKTFEFCDFLVNQVGVHDLGARFAARVTMHDGCHDLRDSATARTAARCSPAFAISN